MHDVEPDNPGAARAGREHRGQHLDGRCLSSTVRAEQAENALPRNTKLQFVHRNKRTKAARER